MTTFYFVGGPKEGKEAEFFRRLATLGGAPAGWTIFPHANDASALPIVTASGAQEILDHLENFRDIYERGEIVEVRTTAGTPSRA